MRPMPSTFVVALVLFLAPAAAVQAQGAGAVEVDLELVLAADGSGSIDDNELALQRAGYAAAVTDPEILNLILGGLHGRMAVAYVEWGAPTSQHTIVDWTLIDGPDSAEAFARALRDNPRQAYGYNSISEALAYSAGMIESNAYQGVRKIIDVSGDGPNIGGRPLAVVREAVLSLGITINALVVASPGGGFRGPGGIPLSVHYERDIIGGPGSFVVVAEGREKFAEAIRRKMILEIANAIHGTTTWAEARAAARRPVLR